MGRLYTPTQLGCHHGLCRLGAGYVIHKAVEGARHRLCCAITAKLLPCTSFTLLLIVNVSSCRANLVIGIPFASLLVHVGLWDGVSVPLVCLGAFLGFKSDTADVHVPNPSGLFPSLCFANVLFAGMLVPGLVAFLRNVLSCLYCRAGQSVAGAVLQKLGLTHV